MDRRVDGVRASLWRALAVFRLAGLVVALVLIVHWQHIYARPDVALLVGAAMLVVTAALVPLAVSGRAHRRLLVAADVVITALLTVLTVVAQTPAQYHGGMVTLTTVWGAGPAIEGAFVAGAAGGMGAAVLQYLVTAGVADSFGGRTLYSGVLLVLAGGVVGLVTSYAVRAEDELRIASAAQAQLAERERLGRSIHDGVLQILGLVHRTGRDADEPWRRLALEAGRQEEALRALITSRPVVVGDEHRDLTEALRTRRSDVVTVSTPAGPTVLPATTADEILAAVDAALANVGQHAGAGARAWVVLDVADGELRIAIRDDGVGIAPGRVVAAERTGRLGIARSIRGRVEDLGGRCDISARPGEGTTVELVIPCGC